MTTRLVATVILVLLWTSTALAFTRACACDPDPPMGYVLLRSGIAVRSGSEAHVREIQAVQAELRAGLNVKPGEQLYKAMDWVLKIGGSANFIAIALKWAIAQLPDEQTVARLMDSLNWLTTNGNLYYGMGR